MNVHHAATRGFADHGWLKSHHTFSFADYYNPERMGFGVLRVINDDSVAGAMGFGTHPHRDMEIISIPLEGALAHKDSTGTSSIIRKGEVQIMSAGTGILHSEYNANQDEAVKFLQIWVIPEKMGIKPRYEQKAFSVDDRKNKFQLVVSPDGRDGSVSINQNAFFSLSDLDSHQEIIYTKKSHRNGVYVMLLKGKISVNGEVLNARDGMSLEVFHELSIKALESSELLIMEVPV